MPKPDDDRGEDGEQRRRGQLALGGRGADGDDPAVLGLLGVVHDARGARGTGGAPPATTVPAERPTARMARAEKRKAIDPPISRPMKIVGLRHVDLGLLAG